MLQVPIMVTANATTDDNTYFGHTEEVCRTCDVVVRDGATLTKATDGATDDRAEVRDLTIYPGATLKVPTGTNYTAASLIMRAKNDVVSEATITGTLNISNLYHDRRMDGKQYYFFCLPYDCAVADLIYSNGKSLGLRGTDWEIKYYDGANRATSSGTSGSWRAFTDATLQAGIGYIIAIDATGDETKEVRFPMSYAAETTDKSIAVDDHGITTAITPNHKGWNLIGNPFLAQYSATPGSGLIVGALELDADGEYVLNTTAGVPYVTIPMNGGDYYIQERANNRALSPLTSFFVQVAGTDPSVDETNLAMLFTPSDRVPAPQMESDSYDNPLWIPVTLSNDTDNDVTTIVLHQSYSSDYEIGADLEKMMGSTTKPQLYSLNNSTRMAFNALPDSVSQHILLGYKAATAGDYTFTVQQDKVMPYVKAIWLTDNSESKCVNLLTQPYAFTTAVTDNSSRFLLSIDVDREVSSSVTDGLIDEPLVTTKNLTIEVRHLPESGTIAVIDALGRVIEERSISATEMLFTMPQQGIYLVRITSNKGSFIVKCIVK